EGWGLMVTEPDRGFAPRPDSLAILQDDQKIEVGRLVLSVGPSGELLANGSPDFKAEAGFRVISQPRVSTKNGSLAIIRTGLKSRLQYMVRQPDGDFRLMTSDPEPRAGMEIKVIPRVPDEPSVADATIDLEYSSKTTFLVGRVEYPDVELDIGEPLFLTRETETSRYVPLNRWMLIQSTRGKEASDGATTQLITMMRIFDYEP
ncbi:MAG: hypothetical protein K8R59_15440, partial [Thermoanaerobaculales bacterium]|nr:hypothetical protein [Thermoanaerobaculales bacterium]